MSTEMILEQLETPVRYSCDVAVCGGGTAGFVAALAAARNGVRTVLIEERGYVGGTLVNGAGPLHSFFNLYNAWPEAEKVQLIHGIAQELVERLQERGASFGHLEQKKGGDYDSMITLIDWEGFKELALEMLEEAGVKLLLHTSVAAVRKEENRVTGLILQGRSGREALSSKVVIDTTGNADVAALAGCGIVKRHQTTSVGMPFSMTNVDMTRLVAWLKEKDLITQLIEGDKGSEVDHVIRLGFDLKKVPEFTKIMEETGMWGPLGYSYHENEFTYINATSVKSVDATDTEAVTAAEIALRHQVWLLSEMLKKHIPGFENAYVSWTPDSIGVRLTRIVECMHEMTLEEITEGKRFDDEVFLYGFHDCAPRITIKEGKWYGFPYRAMVPERIDGILAAGRCLTGTWEAHMSTRNTVSCMAQGQAAGTAAALCAAENMVPRALDAQKLRAVLKEQGVFLEGV